MIEWHSSPARVAHGFRSGVLLVSLLLFQVLAIAPAVAQSEPQTPAAEATTPEEKEPAATVEVRPTVDDGAIATRLTEILRATEWYEQPAVTVRDGVAFLSGTTDSQPRKEWATNLAQKTRDVVAVVNRMSVEPRVSWDFGPAFGEIRRMSREFVQAIPHILLATIVLIIAWFAAGLVRRMSSRWLSTRVPSPLLAAVLARAIAVPFFLLGLYVILQISGLTRLALTIIGGTGVVGIVVGFAFRDIAENFLASILLSIRRPFLTDDFIEVDGHAGLVRNMNTRTTVLMTPDGNHVQIPNATVFKSTIVNFTANPNCREDFLVSVGYEHSITKAQEVVMAVLESEETVLAEPPPMILVDELGSSAINLRVYYWFDFTKHSKIKLRSFLMRRALRDLEKAGITAPDDAREIVFPEGVPVVEPGRGLRNGADDGEDATPSGSAGQPPPCVPPAEDETSRAEGGLSSERHILKEQDRRTRSSEDGEDLLQK